MIRHVGRRTVVALLVLVAAVFVGTIAVKVVTDARHVRQSDSQRSRALTDLAAEGRALQQANEALMSNAAEFTRINRKLAQFDSELAAIESAGGIPDPRKIAALQRQIARLQAEITAQQKANPHSTSTPPIPPMKSCNGVQISAVLVCIRPSYTSYPPQGPRSPK